MTVAKPDPDLSDTVFDLGGWQVEPRLNRISNGGVSAHLEPKTMAVLLCLAEHAGDVVSRQVIVDQVWATEFISDSTLTHAVADLRRAFADDPKAPRFIETIPKRGYRLVANVGESGSGGTPPSFLADHIGRTLAVVVGPRALISRRALEGVGERFLIFGEQEIPLIGSVFVFGRDADTEIRIVAPEVSRRHAKLEIGNHGAIISDLGSKNGTLVNDQIINQPTALSSGDVIGVGRLSMTFCHISNDPTRTAADA
jgi:DNA-binding winged helix-turn-helix (wHTH) protein